MAILFSEQQIRRYAQRRGNAIEIVGPAAVPMVMAQIGPTPAKRLRIEGGLIAIVYEAPAGGAKEQRYG